MGAGGKVLVAASAASALGDDQALVGNLEVVYQLAGFLVVKGCAHRHLQHDRVAVEPGAVGSHAVLAALRFVLGVIAEMDQRVVPLRRLHHHVAAAAAVAARRAAARHKLLAPEGHAAIAAVAGFYADFCFIDKHGWEETGASPQAHARGAARLFSLPSFSRLFGCRTRCLHSNSRVSAAHLHL